MCELIKNKIQRNWFHQNSQGNDADCSECILSKDEIIWHFFASGYLNKIWEP